MFLLIGNLLMAEKTVTTEVKKKNTKRRSPSEMARDQRIVADLYLQGELQVDIAKVIGRDQTTVSTHLAAIRQEWLDSSLRDFDEVKSQELAKLDKLEREYYGGWLRSQEDVVTVKDETSENPKTVVTTKSQAGDSRFLDGVERCVARRCKILGFDAPSKTELEAGPQLADVLKSLPSDFREQVRGLLTERLSEE
jgi:hypothetical protein